MRHLSSATLAAAIALAFATGAGAATTPPKPSITNINATGTFMGGTPFTPGGNNASTSPSSTTTTTVTTTTPPSNTTTVDVRNQQTLAAVAANHAAGSTSSLGPLAGASTVNGITPGTTSGMTPGTTTETSSSGTGTTVGTTGNPGIGVPVFNTFLPSDVTSTGTVAASANAPVLASNGVFSSDVYGAPVLSANVTTPDQAANDAAVNRALRQVTRDRARIGRNGQLLYSIAPRTNVDRSSQMPDDGPSPSLSGYYSSLTR